MRVLITAKAYPTVSVKYGEAVCVAGIRLDTPQPQWVRLFPVTFRELAAELQFKKYEVISLEARKHSSDTRVETWRPNTDTIVREDFVPAGGPWTARRKLIEPLVGPTMCALHRGRKKNGSGPSLGLIRPAQIRDLAVGPEGEWSSGQLGTIGQGNLLTTKSELTRPAHAFSYRYTCEEPGCKGHRQKVVDWELGESYRRWPQRGDALVEAIKQKWFDSMCADGRETMFFVGDQHTRPGQFLVLGTWYPERLPHVAQLSFGLAA
jgi:hypothetical protein